MAAAHGVAEKFIASPRPHLCMVTREVQSHLRGTVRHRFWAGALRGSWGHYDDKRRAHGVCLGGPWAGGHQAELGLPFRAHPCMFYTCWPATWQLELAVPLGHLVLTKIHIVLVVKEKCLNESLIVIEQVLKVTFECERPCICNWHSSPTREAGK